MYLSTMNDIFQRMVKDGARLHGKEYLYVDTKLGHNVVAVHSFKYYAFYVIWMWTNRKWKNTRQKLRAMKKDWEKYISRKRVL